jgi:hypothetical protein
VSGGRRASAGLVSFAVAAGLSIAVAMTLVACGPGPSVGPSASASLGPGGVGPPITLPPDATPLVRIDSSLLAVLPEEVAGLSVLESSDAEIDAQANGSLASLSDGVAGALAIDPGTADFVLADVVRLRPNALTDAIFQQWRESFDKGVCLESGVIGQAQGQIGGRTVFVGTCGNGFRTYHTWIADKNLLVSASAGGKRELGRLLFEALRP